MTHGARARILPGALAHNLEVIRRRAPGARVMAAVKGNAYGHGLATAARAFAAADSLAVARLSEAESLREAGIPQPLVLLAGITSAADLERAAALAAEPVVHCLPQVEMLEARPGRVETAWLKVDTGMHRLGFPPATVPGLLVRLRGAVRDLRLMTHLAAADVPQDPLNAAQIDAFRALTRGFGGDISIVNSPALFSWSADMTCGDFWGQGGATWARPGIALYGITPFADGCGSDLGLEPAMRFESRLLDVRPLARGERVGYGGAWAAPSDTTLGVVAAGYADGYTRFLPSGTPVLVNGRRVTLAGTVSMDIATVDLGAGATDRPGDPVLLWGDALPVEEVARAARTIPYQLVAGVLHREAPAYGAEHRLSVSS